MRDEDRRQAQPPLHRQQLLAHLAGTIERQSMPEQAQRLGLGARVVRHAPEDVDRAAVVAPLRALAPRILRADDPVCAQHAFGHIGDVHGAALAVA